jgi:hypothetical protein
MNIPGSLESNISSQSFIEFISNLQFDSVYENESKQNDATIIHLGDMTYRMMDSNEDSNVSQTNRINDEDSKLNVDSQITSDDPADSFVSSWVQLHVVPVQPDIFLAQLPQHLSSFIQEVVTIVKQYNVKTQLYDYHFQFKRLNLDILFKKHDDVLKIVIQVGDKVLQDELNSDRQKSMIQFLQTKLDTIDIDVEFDFLSNNFSQSNSNNGDSESNDSAQNDDADNDES